MTTPIAQNQTLEAPRKELPPVEREAAPQPATPPNEPSTAANDASFEARAANGPAHDSAIDSNGPPGPLAKSVAHWIHKHPEAHSRTIFGRTVYQYVRSFAASVPYGLSMAGVLAGLTGMQSFGNKLNDTAKSPLVKGIGRNLAGFASFKPAQNALLIGTSFTLYRGTSKLGKWMTEYLFNPKDSEERTAEKVDDLPQEAWRKIKEIAPAESSSTPVSAIVLGFIVAAFQKPVKDPKNPEILVDIGKGAAKKTINADWTRKNFLETAGWGNRFKLMMAALKPQTKFVQHAAINTFGYSLFFELGDRLFKDTQIRRGVWPGEHNSIKALKAAPDEYAKGIQEGNEASKPKFEDGAVEAAPEKHHYKFFTSEPGVGRFLFRRVLPTAVGITAYTATKMRWGTMLGNNFTYDKGISFTQFGKKAWGEGLATSLFFLIPIVSEPYEKWYDNFFAKKEKVAQLKDRMKENPEMVAKDLTPEQQQNYDQLLARVNAKAANESKYQQRA